MKDQDQRLIEDYLPVRQISYEATREKVTRRRDRHITMLHLWWARRPLAAARAAVYAALVPTMKGGADRKALDGFFEKLCHWGDPIDVADARKNIASSFEGRAPKVLDPFAGGGAIPLEAIRLGCETYGVELNPVAYLINLCTNVYPQQYGDQLHELVAKWGKTLIDAVRADVGNLYPALPDPVARGKQAKQLELAGTPASAKKTLTPIAYLWTRTVPCSERPNQAPHLVPLVRQTWLVFKKNRYVALRMVPDRKTLTIRYDVVEAETEADLGFDPAAFSTRGNTTCPLCTQAISAEYIQEQGKLGRLGTLPLAVVCAGSTRGKVYKPIGDSFLVPASEVLDAHLKKLALDGFTAPDEIIPDKNTRDIRAPLYGMTRYGDLFTRRQLVTLLTFVKHVHRLHDSMRKSGVEEGLARAVTSYLALLLDRLVDRSTMLCHWDNTAEKTANTYARQALPMVWDFSETNPFSSSSGSASENLKQILMVIEHCSKTGAPAKIVRGSATRIPLDDSTLDAVITDPPYYDNISYAELADFFYVWLKRSVGRLYPEHFGGDLTPKKTEIVAATHRHENDKTKAFNAYETLMYEALSECCRVLKPGCPLVAVYAHKTTAGWATLIKALRRAKFVVTEAWPLDTEMPDRAGQMNTAHLATSIFIVARKRESEETGDYLRQVRPQLQAILAERVKTLFGLGVSGSDLIIASLGAGLRAYTQFAKVELPNGDELSEAAFLDETQREVLEIVLAQVLHCDRHGVGAVDKPTQFYVLGRFEYGEEPVDFGEVNVLAKGVGVEVDGTRGMHPDSPPLVKISKSEVTLLSYTKRGADEALGALANGVGAPLIDVLHRLLWLAENEPGRIGEFLIAAQPEADKLRLIAQSLAGRTISGQAGERTDEQKALDRILASWRNVVEQNLFTRGRA